MSFKDVKQESCDSAIEKIEDLINNLYQEYLYLLSSNSLNEIEKKSFKNFAQKKISKSLLENSIQYLSKLLFKHFKQPPIILIDEYDTPIQEAYLHGYYNEFVQFIVNMLGAGLKDSGTFRQEVTDLLAKTKTKAKTEEIKNWYNGYRCGDTVLYNPWSIINCIADGGQLKPYWINTSGNKLAKRLLLKSGTQIHRLLQHLIQNQHIEVRVDEHVVYGNIETQGS